MTRPGESRQPPLTSANDVTIATIDVPLIFFNELDRNIWFASIDDAQQKIDAFRWDYMSIILTALSRA